MDENVSEFSVKKIGASGTRCEHEKLSFKITLNYATMIKERTLSIYCSIYYYYFLLIEWKGAIWHEHGNC